MRNKRVCCPKCEGFRTKITCQQVNDAGSLIRRYRKCLDCEHKFRTTQPVEFHDDDGIMWGNKSVERGAHPQARFTTSQVRQIRSAYKLQNLTYYDLALRYDCCYHTIAKIITHKSYKNC